VLATGGPWYSEAGLAKAVFGVGQAGPSAPLDTAPSTFAYAPPTPGAVLAGIAAAQCLWPPPAGGYGAVLCNMQFAFASAGAPSLRASATVDVQSVCESAHASVVDGADTERSCATELELG